MKGNRTVGHLSALLTIIIWGTAFISTKILLADFQPVEILFFRFVMGLLALLLVYPRRLKGTNRQLELTRFANPVYLFNILFLGLGALALCFVTWNFAVKALGAVKTSVYIYMVPVITVVTSVAILHEKITALAAIGTFLTLAGLLLSEGKLFLRKEAEQNGLAK